MTPLLQVKQHEGTNTSRCEKSVEIVILPDNKTSLARILDPCLSSGVSHRTSGSSASDRTTAAAECAAN